MFRRPSLFSKQGALQVKTLFKVDVTKVILPKHKDINDKSEISVCFEKSGKLASSFDRPVVSKSDGYEVNINETLSLVCTMYKSNKDSNKFLEKEGKLIVRLRKVNKGSADSYKGIGVATVQLDTIANAYQPMDLTLPLAQCPGAMIHVRIIPKFVGEMSSDQIDENMSEVMSEADIGAAEFETTRSEQDHNEHKSSGIGSKSSSFNDARSQASTANTVASKLATSLTENANLSKELNEMKSRNHDILLENDRIRQENLDLEFRINSLEKENSNLLVSLSHMQKSSDFKAENAKLEVKVKELEELVTKLNSTNSRAETFIDDLQKENEGKNNKLNEQQVHIQQLEAKLAELQSELSQLDELKSRESTTNENIQQYINSINELTTAKERNESNIEAISRQNESLQHEIYQLQESIKLLQAASSQASDSATESLRQENTILASKVKSLEEKLETSNSNLQRITSLNSKAESCIVDLRNENDLLSNQINELQQQLSGEGVSENLGRTSDLLSDHGNEISSMRENKKQLEATIESLQIQIKELESCNVSLQSEITSLSSQVNSSSSLDFAYEEALEQERSKTQSLVAANMVIEGKLERAESKVEELEATVEELESKLAESADIEELKSERDQLIQYVTDLQEECTQWKQQNKLLEDKIDSLNSQIQWLSSSNSSEEAQADDLRRQVVSLQNQIEELLGEKKEVDSKLEIKYLQLESDLQASVAEISGLKAELESNQALQDRLKSENEELEREINELKNTYAQTSKLLEAEQRARIEVESLKQNEHNQLESSHDSLTKALTEIDSLKAELTILTREKQASVEEGVQSSKRITELEKTIYKLRLEKESTVDDLSSKGDDNLRKIAQLEEKLELRSHDVQHLADQNKKAEGCIFDLRNEIVELSNQIAKLESERVLETGRERNSSQDEKEMRILTLQQDLNELKGKCDEHLDNNSHLQEKYDSVAKENSLLHDKNIELQQRITSLQEQLTQLQEDNLNLHHDVNVYRDEITLLSTPSTPLNVADGGRSFSAEYIDGSKSASLATIETGEDIDHRLIQNLQHEIRKLSAQVDEYEESLTEVLGSKARADSTIKELRDELSKYRELPPHYESPVTKKIQQKYELRSESNPFDFYDQDATVTVTPSFYKYVEEDESVKDRKQSVKSIFDEFEEAMSSTNASSQQLLPDTQIWGSYANNGNVSFNETDLAAKQIEQNNLEDLFGTFNTEPIATKANNSLDVSDNQLKKENERLQDELSIYKEKIAKQEEIETQLNETKSHLLELTQNFEELKLKLASKEEHFRQNEEELEIEKLRLHRENEELRRNLSAVQDSIQLLNSQIEVLVSEKLVISEELRDLQKAQCDEGKTSPPSDNQLQITTGLSENEELKHEVVRLSNQLMESQKSLELLEVKRPLTITENEELRERAHSASPPPIPSFPPPPPPPLLQQNEVEQLELTSLQDENQQLKQRLTLLDEKCKSLELRLDNIQAEKDRTVQSFEEYKAEHNEEMSSHKSSIDNAFLQQELNIVQGELAACQATINELKSENEYYRTNYELLQKSAQNGHDLSTEDKTPSSSETESLLNELINSKMALATLSADLDEEKKKSANLNHRLQKYAERITALEVAAAEANESSKFRFKKLSLKKK